MSLPSSIVRAKIHPAIGIARLGKSPDEYYLGPEISGHFELPEGGYKDAGDPAVGIPPRLKRRGARFRIYGYDAAGNPVQEITAEDAGIEWQVQLGNKKAAWFNFNGTQGEDGNYPPASLNNLNIARELLVIRGNRVTLPGAGRPAERIAGTFQASNPAREVVLGEAFTEEVTGRLVVLGGFADSQSWTQPPLPIVNYANNNGWIDDTSDGPVTASVRRADGTLLAVDPAWVICAPPDYAPSIPNLVTLYDVLFEVAVGRGFLHAPVELVYGAHIRPILKRVMAVSWVNKRGLKYHGRPSSHGNFFEHPYWQGIEKNGAEHAARRGEIFERVRIPGLDPATHEAQDQAVSDKMPPLSGDNGDVTPGVYDTWLTLTSLQYDWLKRWQAGQFTEGDVPAETEVTPGGLDRAVLEAACGGALFPGMEAGWILRRSSLYMGAFRIDHDHQEVTTSGGTARLEAGDISKRMAVPWQADFYECRTNWWPAQRPDDVLRHKQWTKVTQLDAELALLPPGTDAYIRKKTERDTEWGKRDSWEQGASSHETMLANWWRLGVVSDHDETNAAFTMDGKAQFVEIERDPALDPHG